jgi:Uma2 family endonuclease
MQPTSTPSHAEEFPYGWRYVQRGDTLEQVPLTLEDVLHPREGDVIPENTLHESDCRYLADVFATRALSPPRGLVTRDLLVNWGVPGMRNHSPDVAVFVGLSRDPGETGLLELPSLGGRCEVVVEVVSPNTRDNDVVAKFDHYHRIGIPWYVLIDQPLEGGPRFLRAYRRKPERYAEVESDDRERIDLPPLGLMLGLRDNRVVCYDLATGEEVGDYSSIVRALEEADRLAEQRQQAYEDQVEARQQAERRANEAEKEADKLNQEADRQRKEAERAQKEADRQRDEAERAQKETDRALKEADRQRLAREAADQTIRELQETLRRLQAGGTTDATNPTT